VVHLDERVDDASALLAAFLECMGTINSSRRWARLIALEQRVKEFLSTPREGPSPGPETSVR
jgi:hypothetical protein